MSGMLSIVIITCNSIEFLKASLRSVEAQEYHDYELIVVDNGSQDGTASFIRSAYPAVLLIENDINRGAAEARNRGIDASSGEWVLTLDCDCVLEKDFLAQISKAIAALPQDTGIIQPKILRVDKKTIYSAGIKLTYFRRFRDIGSGRPDGASFARLKPVFGACSAAAVYKKEMLLKVNEATGFFDERFFFLVEDVDLAWRAQSNGYKAWYYPQAVCSHHGNASGTGRKFRQYLCFKNRRLLISKNDKRFFLNNILVACVYDLPRILYLLLTNKYMQRSLRQGRGYRLNMPGQ
jgi:GT2 family glycosyltransferase